MPDDKLGCRCSKSFSLHGCMLIYVNKMSVSYDQDTNEIEVYKAKLRQKLAAKLWTTLRNELKSALSAKEDTWNM